MEGKEKLAESPIKSQSKHLKGSRGGKPSASMTDSRAKS